jgi:hypothetical protein
MVCIAVVLAFGLAGGVGGARDMIMERRMRHGDSGA